MSVPDFRETTVEALANAVRHRELTAADVTEAALDRIAERNPTLNAFVALDADDARAQAAEIDDRIAAGDDVGPLAGIPIGVKDLAHARGFATVRGAMHLRRSDPVDFDSTEVARMRAAGCVVLGKTNTPEFGWTGDTYNPVFGATLNPWNLERSPGGSSGGTSSAVASGMIPLGTGSDGGGSIRIPSGVTAMSGFKATQGVIPHGPDPRGAQDLSTVGPMARRIRDVALTLDVVAGPSPADLRSVAPLAGSFRAACDAPAAPTRLLWCASLDGSPVDDEVAAITGAVVDQLRADGVEVVECDSPLAGTLSPFLMLFYGSMVPAYREVIDSDAYADVTPGLRAMVDAVLEKLTVDNVERAREKAQRASVVLAETMAGFDALLTPMTVGQTPRSQGDGYVNGDETPIWVANTMGLNLARRPAGVTHAGFAADAMPVALQIVGHQLADLDTLALTAWMEDYLGFDPVAPDLPA